MWHIDEETIMKTIKTALAHALVLAMVAAPAALAQNATERASTPAKTMEETQKPDAWVLTKVKAQFAASDLVKASNINVDVTNGAVSLTGTVSGVAEKNEAIRLAQSTEGVTSVNSQRLVVGADEMEEHSHAKKDPKK